MRKVYKAKNGETIIITDANLENIMKREGFEFVEDLDEKPKKKKTEE